MSRTEFFYDLGSPYAWLTAERIDGLFDQPPVWTPVLLGGIFKATGRGSWAQTEARAEGIAEVERRALSRGLPPVRWADPWPNDGLHVMRVAAHADSRSFALAAFRAHFNGARALSDPETVAAIAARVGIEPIEDKQKLRENTDRALELGVTGVPSIVVGGHVFWGDDRLDAIAASARDQQLQ
jgi:2-hydroxychromene-2-carboxylate isomerase